VPVQNSYRRYRPVTVNTSAIPAVIQAAVASNGLR
jgi:hypothetical protein